MKTVRVDKHDESEDSTVQKTCVFIGFNADEIDKGTIMERFKIAEDIDAESVDFNDRSYVKCSPVKCEPIIASNEEIIIRALENHNKVDELAQHLATVNNELATERIQLIRESESERTKFNKLMSEINENTE